MSQIPYSFCFLRYFHEPLSGEFANVGLVLWAPKKNYLGFRFSSRFQRLSHFFHDFHSEDYRQMIRRIETRFGQLQIEYAGPQSRLPFDRVPEHARDLASLVVPIDDGALQWSKSSGGVTNHPEGELETLFQNYIAKHYESVAAHRRDEKTVFREVFKKAFDAPSVRPHIREHTVKAHLAKHTVQHTFEHAWQNGVWNVYQTVSFDLKKNDDILGKALTWDSRTKFLASAEEHPCIHLLLGKPSDEERKDAYGAAKEVLASSDRITLIEEDQVDQFAEELARKVQAAK
ncbi:MAG: hypothetical protein CMO55_06760 [Verrucomicrobiales bacterium]|nr:hypothetical protein [Verrucomicrobiales bacterium]